MGLFASAGLAFPQSAWLRSAETVTMPTRADCTSPAFWSDGQLVLFNSTGTQWVSRGGDQFSESTTQLVGVDRQDHVPMWIESVWRDEDGTLYGWYHHEPAGVCGSSKLTAPVIGAVVSRDGGKTFEDLGIVLSSGGALDCDAKNGFFAGGNGDFSVILDRNREYFYFLFDNYGGDIEGQGVAIARMAFADRQQPVGAVWKYFDSRWMEAGLGGRNTPVFRASVRWQDENTDAYWGPSVHWNTYLERYVVLMNHTCCRPEWPQEGIYITFSADLSDPAGWTPPVKILGKVDYDAGFYPQVLGTGTGETETLAGESARLYVHGRSDWTIEFSKEGFPSKSTPDPEPIDPTNPLPESSRPRRHRN